MTEDVIESAGLGKAARLADLFDDVATELIRHPVRSTLLGMGLAAAVGVFLFSFALTTTSARQVALQFDQLAATEVDVLQSGVDPEPMFDPQVEGRLEALPGVTDAGVSWSLGELRLGVGPARLGTVAGVAPVEAVSVDIVDILDMSVDGPGFSHPPGAPEAIVSAVVAAMADPPLTAGMPITVEGEPFRVVGILDDVASHSEFLLSVMVPAEVAVRRWPSQHERERIHIAVAVGAASLIADEAPLVIDPYHADQLIAQYPPEPEGLRQAVGASVDAVPLLIAVGLLVSSGVAIATAWYAGILGRRSELGMRRALGASRGSIAALVLAETTLVATVASVAGLALGAAAFVVVSGSRGWVPSIPMVALASPAVGIMVGVLAGLVPAIRASRIDPAAALRQ